jgi:CRP-like cAMP-binding protein
MTKTAINYFHNVKEFDAYMTGETIFKVGDPDKVLYAVLEGEVEILFNGQVLEVVGEGGIMGEKSLVDDNPHTTTAIARTDCKIARVDERQFMFLVQETPMFAIHVMRVMAQRTRDIMMLSLK